MRSGEGAVLRPLVRRLWDLEVSGIERLPAEGPAILCPNHISFIDSAFLMLSVPQHQLRRQGRVHGLVEDQVRVPGARMIPIDRGGGSEVGCRAETAAAVLRRGELFGIYPEGTRSRSGKLHKGRTGAARLAIELDVPIFPVGIVGTDEIQPPDAAAPRLFRSASITIGRPVKPDRYARQPERHRALRSMIDEVMFEISQLSGREYVDAYAGSSSDADIETRAVAAPATVEVVAPAAGDDKVLISA